MPGYCQRAFSFPLLVRSSGWLSNSLSSSWGLFVLTCCSLAACPVPRIQDCDPWFSTQLFRRAPFEVIVCLKEKENQKKKKKKKKGMCCRRSLAPSSDARLSLSFCVSVFLSVVFSLLSILVSDRAT